MSVRFLRAALKPKKKAKNKKCSYFFRLKLFPFLMYLEIKNVSTAIVFQDAN